MKILKYIFLLIILAFIGAAVFVATQKSNISSKHSTYIKIPRNAVFSYMNDYHNWEQWESWKEDDASMKFVYPENSKGLGAFYSWNGNTSEGKASTTNVVVNEKIEMVLDFDGNKFNSIITFKDTLSGTKISWKSDGKIGFVTKVYATFSGGINKYFSNIFERSLNNLNAVLTRQINNFRIEVSGLITIPPRYFVKRVVFCHPSDMQSTVNLGVSKINFFFKNNNLKMNGKPFVMKEYETKDTLKLAIYGPLKEEIFISEGSDLTAGYMAAFTALKLALVGDYSHINEARNKAQKEFNARQLRPSETILPMDVYFKTVEDNKSPSKWVTFIQIPIYEKPLIVPKKYKPKPKPIEQIEELKPAESVKEEF